ncbi:MAG TPA: putative Ig domain-containing protein [Bryobacteraceae bacterium]|nr:putative Ig domain-containing protein [Bryobacteraceae bacterium]
MSLSFSSSKSHLSRKRLAASLLVALALPVASAQTNVFLAGHVSPRVSGANRLGRVAPDEPIRLTLAVRVDEALLKETLDSIYGPNTPASKRYLTSAEFAQKFELSAKRDRLRRFAQAHGLTVNAAEDQEESMVVSVSGNAGTIEQAFGIQLNRYRDAAGRMFRAHESDPIIPAVLQADLHAVFGLSDIQGVFRSGLHAGPVAPSSGLLTLSGTGPGGGLAPSDIKTIYGLPTAPTVGAGQTVAVFELAQFNPADLAIYSKEFDLPNVPLTVISVDGVSSICAPGSCTDPATAEVDLDTELIAGVAPGLSQILVYDGPNTQQGFFDVFNQIATDNLAQVVSTSWFEFEAYAGSAMLQAENQIFQRMAAQGQTLFGASGDSGGYGPGGASVEDPAAQPFVTAVGGTSLAGTVQAPVETAWNGSGGGPNAFWPLPVYQAGLAGAASQQFRNEPDVALNADPNSPYATYVDGSWHNFGGTSASAPVWAAFTAIVNQQRVASGLPPTGFANPLLYRLASSSQYNNLYRDITSGNNGLYTAGPGYDNVTGWGSLRGAPLLNAMAQASNSVGIYSPAAGTDLVSPVTISGSAFASAFASYRVEYGAGANPTAFNLIGSVHNSPLTFGALETWNTTGLSSGIYTLRLTVTDTSNQTTSATITPLYVDNTPPTAPAQVNLSAQSSTTLNLSWTAASDNFGVAGYRLDLSTSAQFSSFVPGYQNFNAQTATSAVINSLAPSTTYFARVRAYDAVGNVSTNSPTAQATTLPSTLPAPIAGIAVYDPVLLAPACRLTGPTCDSGILLNGRDSLAGGAEPNQPNTLFNSCADGTSGTYHSDESIDHLTISTLDGQPFAPGKTVRVDATVWAYTNPGSDSLDLYSAPNANSPVWTLIETIKPTVAGAQVLSVTFALPNGSLQAVRGNFRFSQKPNPCTSGGYDDHDDLAFAVGLGAPPPPVPVILSPSTAIATAGSAFSYAISASNNPTSFNATGLPVQLTINTATGLIAGTPQSAGTYTINLSATNAGGTGTGTLVLTVKPGSTPPPTITSPLSASGNVGASFSYNITGTNNPTSYNAIGLPSGLSINTANGLISGVPASTGVFQISMTASNAGGTGSAFLTLTISPQLPPSAPVAAITVTPLSGSAPLTVTGDASASTGGNLFYSWNFGDHSVGFGAVVSHTYTQPGTYSITVTVSNDVGSDHTRNIIVVSN